MAFHRSRSAESRPYRWSRAVTGAAFSLSASLLLTTAPAAAGTLVTQGYFSFGTAQFDAATGKSSYWVDPYQEAMVGNPAATPTSAAYYSNQVVSYLHFIGNERTVSFGQSYYGTPGALNTLTFTPDVTPQTGVSLGSIIKLGTLTFTNGTFDGKWVDLSLRVYTLSSDTTLNLHYFDTDVRIVMNPGIGTAEDGADWLYLPSYPGMGSVRVYESFNAPAGTSNVGSVDLYGEIGSLYPTEFRNPTGGAFLNSSVVDALATRVSAAPESGIWAMLLVGFGMIGLTARGRALRAAR